MARQPLAVVHALIVQVKDYALYAWRKRDTGVALYGLFFFLLSLAPALVLDLWRLPAALYGVMARSTHPVRTGKSGLAGP